jgi:MarR family transcriptional regulator, organic hydroperoxide resistance regulator
MKSAIQSEIKQGKPFRSLAEEAGVALARTADRLNDRVAALLKPFGVSPTQYNVLRILRGAGRQGRMCSEIGERMITRDPDITRLLDRMQRVGWIERERDTKDRRVVITKITKKGLELLKQIDKPLEEFSEAQMGRLGQRKLRTLLELLAEIRHAEAAG